MSFRQGSDSEAGLYHGLHRLGGSLLRTHSKFGAKNLGFLSLAASELGLFAMNHFYFTCLIFSEVSSGMFSWQRNKSEREENVKLLPKPLFMSFLLTSHPAEASHVSGLDVRCSNVRRPRV